LLRARYTSQNFLVVERGNPGETTAGGEGRLPNELAAYGPEVLMLMEGTNDVTGVFNVSKTIGSLDQMIFDARARGGLSDLPGHNPSDRSRRASNSSIPSVGVLNAQIRDLAARRGVQLVDVFTALNADVPRYYVGNDLSTRPQKAIA
jgi:lysophospholipase L1-like esterase